VTGLRINLSIGITWLATTKKRLTDSTGIVDVAGVLDSTGNGTDVDVDGLGVMVVLLGELSSYGIFAGSTYCTEPLSGIVHDNNVEMPRMPIKVYARRGGKIMI